MVFSARDTYTCALFLHEHTQRTLKWLQGLQSIIGTVETFRTNRFDFLTASVAVRTLQHCYLPSIIRGQEPRPIGRNLNCVFANLNSNRHLKNNIVLSAMPRYLHHLWSIVDFYIDASSLIQIKTCYLYVDLLVKRVIILSVVKFPNHRRIDDVHRYRLLSKCVSVIKRQVTHKSHSLTEDWQSAPDHSFINKVGLNHNCFI